MTVEQDHFRLAIRQGEKTLSGAAVRDAVTVISPGGQWPPLLGRIDRENRIVLKDDLTGCVIRLVPR